MAIISISKDIEAKTLKIDVFSYVYIKQYSLTKSNVA